jgi:hypothetical protein
MLTLLSHGASLLVTNSWTALSCLEEFILTSRMVTAGQPNRKRLNVLLASTQRRMVAATSSLSKLIV